MHRASSSEDDDTQPETQCEAIYIVQHTAVCACTHMHIVRSVNSPDKPSKHSVDVGSKMSFEFVKIDNTNNGVWAGRSTLVLDKGGVSTNP